MKQELTELKKQASAPRHYHIHIHHMDVHQPKLDEVMFHLDNIDIDHLSGALNIGTNIGVSVGKKAEPSSEEPPKVTPSKTGYSIAFHTKEEEE